MHHENVDGSGYPEGLKGDEIPLLGRIVSVADAFDAMTTDRPYSKAMTFEAALAAAAFPGRQEVRRGVRGRHGARGRGGGAHAGQGAPAPRSPPGKRSPRWRAEPRPQTAPKSCYDGEDRAGREPRAPI